MGVFAESLAWAAARTRAYAERLLKGIEAGSFARRARVGGVTVESNHPAFVFGHLSLYPARVMRICGLDARGVEPPAGFEELFRNGVPCVDDPEGRVYPAMERITRAYFDGTDGVLRAIGGLEDAAFARVNPDERYRELFPTVGQAAVFLLNNHAAMHLGQVSVWRRCMGLGPA